jgi:hypothetical protein
VTEIFFKTPKKTENSRSDTKFSASDAFELASRVRHHPIAVGRRRNNQTRGSHAFRRGVVPATAATMHRVHARQESRRGSAPLPRELFCALHNEQEIEMTLVALTLFLPALILLQANAVVFVADRLTAGLDHTRSRETEQSIVSR